MFVSLLRAALGEERARAEKLDARLDTEQRAAQKVAQDITRYVETMQALEAEVVSLRKEGKRRHKLDHKVQMAGDVVTVEIDEKSSEEPSGVGVGVGAELEEARRTSRELTLEVGRLQEHVRSETALRKSLEAKLRVCEEQVRDYEAQLKELKGGLESLHGELERCHNATREQKTTMTTPRRPEEEQQEQEASKEVLELRSKLQRTAKDLTSLKYKSKNLMHAYKQKKESHERLRARLRHVASTLKDVRTVCSRAERNYREVANHLGSELEICARLLAAYLDLTPHFQPIQLYGRDMAGWFADVGAVAAWLRNQIVAFGKRLWTEKEAVKAVLPFPEIPAKEPQAAARRKRAPAPEDLGLNTLSEISEALMLEEETETEVRSVLEAVKSQDQILRVRDAALTDLMAQVK